ncbi:MAG: reverse transcriptase-like protein [Acidobacteriia bacterium]|nr:reverse transcriptase-like protein [Terriglobia bacterium]
MPKIPPPGSGRLFTEAHSSAAPSGVHIANVDGASRGNPGPAAYAVVLRDPDGHVVLKLAKKIGRETNNVAEYYALLAALDYAATHGIRALRIRSDAELLVRQMQGRYKVKSAHLQPLHERARKLARQLDYFAIEHVPREMNRDADELANVALDSAAPGIDRRFSDSDHRPAATGAQAAAPLREEPRPAQTPPPASRRSARPSRIRARFVKGVLVPLESLDLPEETEVLLDLRIALPD